jgi:sortase A
MRRRASLVLAATLALAACGGGGSGGSAATTTAVVEDPIPRTSLPAASTTAPPATVATTTIPLRASAVPTAPATTLPTPVAPPAEDAKEPLQSLGHIDIPKLNVSADLFEGITLSTLDNGPGHWPGTALPGQIGNVVVAGHRTSHSKPFRNIDKLEAGDLVTFTVDGTAYNYVVTSHEIVDPSAVHIVDQTPEPTATLFACHPPGSVAERYVVHLALQG